MLPTTTSRMPASLVTAAVALCCAAGLVVAACGDDTGDGGGGAGAGGAGTGGSDPLTLVPPEPLVADAASDCPGSYATGAPSAGLNSGYEAAGQTWQFNLLLPDASFEGPRPLFVAFNGTGESGPEFSDRAKLQDFAARGFIVLAPSSNGNGTVWPVWDAMHTADDPDLNNPDLAYFDSLVQCIAAHFAVDKHRIYIGGHSAGGIMSNYVLQRRSQLLAGGIVASGVFSLTEPDPPETLDDMMVLVTWGGENDAYSGGTGEVDVPEINFVEQASIASSYYDQEPNVGQANCHGDDIGHAWLDAVNDWMVDLLLAHPKGLPGADGLEVPASPSDNGVTCTTEPFLFEGDVTVFCPSQSTTAGCAELCQLLADCAVENATIGPVLAPQLTALGFSGPDNIDCSGCVTHCESTATEAADAEVLSCISAAASAATCGPGITGGLPAIDAIDDCCLDRTDSPFCMDACGILVENSVTHVFLTNCLILVPPPD